MSKKMVTMEAAKVDELKIKAMKYDNFIEELFNNCDLYTDKEGAKSYTRLYFKGTAIGNWLYSMENQKYIDTLNKLAGDNREND